MIETDTERPLKVFTSRQIQEALLRVDEDIIREFPDSIAVRASAGLALSRLMIALGIETPEDFYL